MGLDSSKVSNSTINGLSRQLIISESISLLIVKPSNAHTHYALSLASLQLINFDTSFGKLANLPNEILMTILEYLEIPNVVTLTVVNKAIFCLLSEDFVWKRFVVGRDARVWDPFASITLNCCYKGKFMRQTINGRRILLENELESLSLKEANESAFAYKRFQAQLLARKTSLANRVFAFYAFFWVLMLLYLAIWIPQILHVFWPLRLLSRWYLQSDTQSNDGPSLFALALCWICHFLDCFLTIIIVTGMWFGLYYVLVSTVQRLLLNKVYKENQRVMTSIKNKYDSEISAIRHQLYI